MIKNIIVSNFKQELFASVFVKSSTGFYKTENNLPIHQLLSKNLYDLLVTTDSALLKEMQLTQLNSKKAELQRKIINFKEKILKDNIDLENEKDDQLMEKC